MNTVRSMIGTLVCAMLLAAAGCADRLSAPHQYVVFFPASTADLTPEGKQVVDRVAANARESRPSKVVVEGHADGGTPKDASLANDRARAVLLALSESGVTPVELAQSAPPPGTTGVAARKVVVRFVP